MPVFLNLTALEYFQVVAHLVLSFQSGCRCLLRWIGLLMQTLNKVLGIRISEFDFETLEKKKICIYVERAHWLIRL